MGRFEQDKWSNKTGKNQANVFETDAKVAINQRMWHNEPAP
jgi:hypothetical protein